MSSGPKYNNKLKDQRVLVFGGTSGIGFAVANAALEQGATVIVSSSNQAKLDKAIERLQTATASAGLPAPNLSGKTANLADRETLEDNIKSLLEFATKDGKLDHVAFTAGDGLQIAGLKDITIDDVVSASMVRYFAPIILAKHLPTYMNDSYNSSFTLTGGVNSWRPSPGWSVVAAAGGGIEALARGLAVDLAPIRTNCVVPGAVNTELFSSIPEAYRNAMLEKFESMNISGRVSGPEELAESYLYFMRNTFTNGTSVVADGGMIVGTKRAQDTQ